MTQYLVQKNPMNLMPNQKEILLIIKDFTLLKLIELEKKFKSLNELLQNISHQWKQPLSELNSIVMNIDLDNQKNKLDNETLDKHLTHIENLTKYMSDTVMDFNTFLSNNKTKNRFNLVNKMNEIVNLFDLTFKDTNINFIIDIDNKINLFTYEGEFKQIILAIIINAKDAITSNNISDGFIKIQGYYINDSICIKIIDNGGGIPNKLINRIFEPYFSTKSKSSSLGLGLYMVYQIINFSMKGTISVKNNQAGAEFSIFLPYEIKKS